jgi:hypothetical protein
LTVSRLLYNHCSPANTCTVALPMPAGAVRAGAGAGAPFASSPVTFNPSAPVPAAAVRSLISPGGARPHSSQRSYPSPCPQAIHPPTHPIVLTNTPIPPRRLYASRNATRTSIARREVKRAPLKRLFRSFNYPVSLRPLSTTTTTARRTSRHVAPSRKQTTHHHASILTPPRRQRPLLSTYPSEDTSHT